MIKLIYHVEPDQKDNELAWLKEMKIFPAVNATWVFGEDNSFKPVVMFGMIVTPDSAVSIKLRHPKIDQQYKYRQGKS